MGTVRLSGATMIHDFIATDRHLVFFAPPLRLKIFKMLLGFGSFGENLEWKPELGTEVVVVPIDAPDQVIRFTTDAFYQWHFANAFEREGRLVVDLVEYPDFASNRQFRGPAPGRAARPRHPALAGGDRSPGAHDEARDDPRPRMRVPPGELGAARQGARHRLRRRLRVETVRVVHRGQRDLDEDGSGEALRLRREPVRLRAGVRRAARARPLRMRATCCRSSTTPARGPATSRCSTRSGSSRGRSPGRTSTTRFR